MESRQQLPPSFCRDSLSGTFSPALPPAHRCRHLVHWAPLCMPSTRNVRTPLSPADRGYTYWKYASSGTCPQVDDRQMRSNAHLLNFHIFLASVQQNYWPFSICALWSVVPLSALIFADTVWSLFISLLGWQSRVFADESKSTNLQETQDSSCSCMRFISKEKLHMKRECHS